MAKVFGKLFGKKDKARPQSPSKFDDEAEDVEGGSPQDGAWTMIGEGHKTKLTKDDFEIKSQLGKGAFGRVLLVRKKDSGNEYAMKIINKRNVLDHGRVQDLFSERSVLRKSKHPYICQLHYAFTSETKLFFIMEYLQGGDLDNYLNQREGKRFDENLAKIYAAQVYTALQYLHEHNIIYRDLKPENILLDVGGNVCLSDFGLSKDFEESEDVEMRANSFVGSPFYVAPDVLRQRKYGNSVDWWSFGVLIFRMVTGTVPFKGANIRAVFDSILHHKLNLAPFTWLTDECKDLITLLLQKEEINRIKGPDIRKHPWFQGVDWDRVDRKEYDMSFKKKGSDLPPAPAPDDIARSPPASGLPDSDQRLFDGFSYTNTAAASLAPVQGALHQ